MYGKDDEDGSAVVKVIKLPLVIMRMMKKIPLISTLDFVRTTMKIALVVKRLMEFPALCREDDEADFLFLSSALLWSSG